MRYLSLCCIARDEDPFFKEWLAYHSLLGVEHFYIYDNESKRPVSDLLDGFADDSRVTVRRIRGQAMQVPAYNDCLASFGKESRWIGFLDLDEFALPVQDNDLRALLAEFEQYGGLAAPWHLFNSSGHLKRPDGPIIKNYTEAFRPADSFQSKCFVQPARTVRALNPHSFSHVDGHYCVNEDHYPLSPRCQPSFSGGAKVRVNHYFVRSQQDFEEKLRRGRADTESPKLQHQLLMFNNALEHPYEEDLTIRRFLPRLEKALADDRLPGVSPFLPAGTGYDELMEAALAFLEAGEPGKGQACLCGASDEDREKADFWTLRAMLAMRAGNLPRADIFIRQSLMREASLTGYRQLEKQLRAMGRDDLAENVSKITVRYSDMFT